MMYRKIHCKIVADLAKDMFNSVFSYLDEIESRIYLENILYIGCLTHDIRKFDKKHGTCGANWIMSKLADNEYCKNSNIPILSIDICNDICILIKFHKSKNVEKSLINEHNPENCIIKEYMKPLIFLIRLSDKLSHFIIESKFKIVNEKDVKDKIDEFLIKTNDYMLDEKLTTSIIEIIFYDFKDMYCNKKIMNF